MNDLEGIGDHMNESDDDGKGLDHPTGQLDLL